MIDMHHSGLPCRSATACRVVFYPARDSVLAVQEAAVLRNAHEKTVHDYTHVVLPEPPSWSFTAATASPRALAAIRRRNSANR